jgi:hypothetical protein
LYVDPLFALCQITQLTSSLAASSCLQEKKVSDYAKSGVNQSIGDNKVHDPSAAKTFCVDEDF